ncbi:MAG: hypothetical protein IAF08_08005 [Rhizobacter sp.]|nr:hypothetical protein [Chlorobiales bacterium]
MPQRKPEKVTYQEITDEIIVDKSKHGDIVEMYLWRPYFDDVREDMKAKGIAFDASQDFVMIMDIKLMPVDWPDGAAGEPHGDLEHGYLLTDEDLPDDDFGDGDGETPKR